MIKFPVFQSLTIERYGLFPSSYDEPFVVHFEPGPSLVVGVNGSGKTTLISLCLRCLTGPFDLPSATSEREFGQVQPRAIIMGSYGRKIFARRVADGGSEAIATLAVKFGATSLQIKRRLSDLALVELFIDGVPIDCTTPLDDHQEDAVFRQTLAKCFGVGTFFDVLIIMRFLVFMLEDRRSLVWDVTAQRQIFRVLMLTPDRASEYATALQAVVSADSAVRNTRTLITRHKKRQKAAAKEVKVFADAEAERRVKIAEAEAVRDKLEKAADDRIEADDNRRVARLARLKAAESRDSSQRELERMKVETLRHWLEPSQDSLRYILGHLLADKRCLVCDTNPSPAAATIENRLRDGLCPVCGANHKVDDKVVPFSKTAQARIKRLESELDLADQQIADAETRIQESQVRFNNAQYEFDTQEERRVNLDREILDVLRKTPTANAAFATAGDDVQALRRILESDIRSRMRAEKRFRNVVAESVARVQSFQNAIANSFGKYLQLFIKEETSLIYQTVNDRVGQTGASFDFPAFRLSMAGGAVAGQTVWTCPAKVPDTYLIYTATVSNARGLFPPSVECLRRGL